MIKDVDRTLLESNLASRNDMIMVVEGTRLHRAGATNSMMIHLVGAPERSPWQAEEMLERTLVGTA